METLFYAIVLLFMPDGSTNVTYHQYPYYSQSQCILEAEAASAQLDTEADRIEIYCMKVSDGRGL